MRNRIHSVKWIDGLAYDGKEHGYSINSTQGIGTGQSVFVNAFNQMEGDTLRVYCGTYIHKMAPAVRRKQVTIANCSPKPGPCREQFGRAVFVGPREEALALFQTHMNMLLTGG